MEKQKIKLENCRELSKRSENNNEVIFIKQVPVPPRNRMKKLAALDEKVHFIIQVPSHPHDRLKRRIKNRKKYR